MYKLGKRLLTHKTILDDSTLLITQEHIPYFSKSEVNKYMEIFQELKSKGTIISGEFTENLWISPYNDINKRIHFDFEIYKDINQALKCYAVLLLKEGISVASTVLYMSLLHKSKPLSNKVF